MDSIDFKEILATTASICTVSQFLAGILVCRKFILNRSTGDASALAFVTCFLSCSLWWMYGHLIGDPFICLVNVFGATLQMAYSFVYLYYTVKKSVIIRQTIGAYVFLFAVYVYGILETDKKVVTSVVGFLSCSLTILFFASPLITLAHVFRSRSAESLPFPIIVATFVASCQWFVYGVLLDDPFIKTPNFLGCLLSGFQLALFVIYRKKKSDEASLI